MLGKSDEAEGLDDRLAAMLSKALERIEVEGDDSARENEYDAFELEHVASFVREAAIGRWHRLAGVAEHVYRRAAEISKESWERYDRSHEPVPWQARPYLNATEVGAAFQPPLRAYAVKDLLAQIGFLERTPTGWKPTDTALNSELVEKRQDSLGNTYVLWKPGIVNHLNAEIDRRANTDDPVVLEWLSPSVIGRAFRKQRSAAAINEMLEQAGLQERTEDGGWKARGEGIRLSRVKTWFDDKKRPAIIEWKPEIVNVLADRNNLALTRYLESAE